MASRKLALIALLAAAASGCGTEDRDGPVLDHAVGAWLADAAFEISIATFAEGCRARDAARELDARVDRAQAGGDVPAALRGELRSHVDGLLRTVKCGASEQPEVDRRVDDFREWLDANAAEFEPGDDTRLPRYAFDAAAPDLTYAALAPVLDAEALEDFDEFQDATTHGQWTLFLIQHADGQINNGGFEQLFGNDGVAFAQDAADAADEIGAREHATLIERAIAARSNPSALSALDDRWYETAKPLQRATRHYVIANRDEFFK